MPDFPFSPLTPPEPRTETFEMLLRTAVETYVDDGIWQLWKDTDPATITTMGPRMQEWFERHRSEDRLKKSELRA